MVSNATKPARMAHGTGSGNVNAVAAIDASDNKISLTKLQTLWLIRRQFASPGQAPTIAALLFLGGPR
jgi:hypothetical protein